MNPQAAQLIDDVTGFIAACRAGQPGEYRMQPAGEVTLYASCFAAMTLYYLGALEPLGDTERAAWIDYLNCWQDPASGLYLGPEIQDAGQFTSARHDFQHVAWHLAAHVLPALAVLGGEPAHPLAFAHPYLDPATLRGWLGQRDWREAWVEGNNLLALGQFLTHLDEAEHLPGAKAALDIYFDWLDSEQDPATGLWGTAAGSATAREALYGGYHQLLAYYYHERPVRYARQLLDVALGIQHLDGGFTDSRGGGACQDVDAVDVIVNMYKRTGARATWVRFALQRALNSILRSQTAEGGFVYRMGAPFMHVGLKMTATPPDQAELFSTWFRVHTIALIGEVLTDHPLAAVNWRFNPVCSMGWHRPGGLPEARPAPLQDGARIAAWAGGQFVRRLASRLRR